MRVLFTIHAGVGHLHPMVPLARALEAAGHVVAFACAESFCPQVERCGFRCFPAGLNSTPGGRRRPSTPSPWIFWSTIAAPAMVPDLLAIAHHWSPDVFVRDPAEYGACLVAEMLAIPHATVAVSALASDYSSRHEIASQLRELRAQLGLVPDHNIDMPFRYLHMAFMPERYHGHDRPLAPTAHFLRPSLFDQSGDELLPEWIEHLADQKTIYVTLGTTHNRKIDIITTVIDSLKDDPFNLVVTIGRNQDPNEFKVHLPNIHIERYVPQTLLLPYCDLVVTHGGFNTVVGALSFGLPLVVVPLGADQPIHARRCVDLQVGQIIEPEAFSASAIREKVLEVLDLPIYRQNSLRLQEEMRMMPGPDHGVKLLEQLSEEKQPILR